MWNENGMEMEKIFKYFIFILFRTQQNKNRKRH